jgi:WD40 repeat protein
VYCLSVFNVLLASGGEDGMVRVWSLPDLTMLNVLAHHEDVDVWELRFHPSGMWLASAGDDGVICLWGVTEVTG